jgi:hypothetical protein
VSQLYEILGTSIGNKADVSTRPSSHMARNWMEEQGIGWSGWMARRKLHRASTTQTFWQQALSESIWMQGQRSSFQESRHPTMTFWRPLTHSCMVGADVSSLRRLSIVMVQPGQDRNSNYFASFGHSGTRGSSGVGDLLPNTLMRPCLVEGGDIRASARGSCCLSCRISR